MLAVAVVAVFAGLSYVKTNLKISEFDKAIQVEEKKLEVGEYEEYDIEEKIGKLKSQRDGVESSGKLPLIIAVFVLAGLVGVLVVLTILPSLAHKFTHAIYDSGEIIEKDPMHDAHSLLAQGKYAEAVEAFKAAARADSFNRLPWVEIAKIQRLHLHDPDAAIHTLRTALEGQEWPMNDAAFLIFRLAEIYDEDRGDRTTAGALMQQVMDEFPETRHSANARHKLHEWGLI